MKNLVRKEHKARVFFFSFFLNSFCSGSIFRGTFVCVDSLHPGQKIFSHVRTISCVPGLNQY